MRNVLVLWAVLLMCVALSSCSGNRPEKAFMGTWKGQYDGDPIELSFMENDIWVVKTSDETSAGTWSIDPDGSARLSYEDGKATAKLTNDGRIVVQPEGESNAAVLEKVPEKK
ncbi:MAG: hypothetical protein JXN61_14420 [Sedimentisphaerales bacterium]|nr:hypothetical protein [Sedimentisphaerales bacterium]